MKKISVCFGFALLFGSASGQGAVLDDRQSRKRPRIRVASSPYPNPLFRVLDDVDLGQHHYIASPFTEGREVSRGHFYSRRGGMIDVAHLRKTVDWAGWLHASIRGDLVAGKTELTYKCSEPSVYHISVEYPEAVVQMSPTERVRFDRELSIELALITSYAALTWHEIITWYGYRAVPGVSERQSAFSYEDMYTHIVGIDVARQALLDDKRCYDEAVTFALAEEAKKLEPMDRAGTKKALASVKGEWWKYMRTLKRFTDIGEAGCLKPWLVDAFPCEDPVCYAVPSLRNIAGVNMTDCITLEIEPEVRQQKKIFAALNRKGGVIRPFADYPRIMADVRKQMIEEFGEGVVTR